MVSGTCVMTDFQRACPQPRSVRASGTFLYDFSSNSPRQCCVIILTVVCTEQLFADVDSRQRTKENSNACSTSLSSRSAVANRYEQMVAVLKAIFLTVSILVILCCASLSLTSLIMSTGRFWRCPGEIRLFSWLLGFGIQGILLCWVFGIIVNASN